MPRNWLERHVSIKDSLVKPGLLIRVMLVRASNDLTSTKLLLQAVLHQPLPRMGYLDIYTFSQGSQWHQNMLA